MRNRPVNLRLLKSILAGFLGCTFVFFVFLNVNIFASFSEHHADSLETETFVPSTTLSTAEPPLTNTSNDCRQLRGSDDVLVVLRTGATTLRSRLPVHLQKTLKCIPHYLLFSDMEEDFEGHQVHNVLSNVSESMQQSAPEFEYYRELHQNRHRIAEFTAENDSTDFRRKAWDLDKWKFVPMVGRALERAAEGVDAKWIMFIEDDSFLVWSNLLQWVTQLDSSESRFFGLPVAMHDQLFAYGGAGWLLSRTAAEQMMRHVASREDSYESFTDNSAFGDLILGHVLEQAGVALTGAWPLIQRETPSTMEYTADVMCCPVVTFHHIDAAEIGATWDLEQEWLVAGDDTGVQRLPLLHFDIFDRLVYPLLSGKVEDWDNFSDGEEKALASEEGFETCRRYCEEDVRCVQFRLTLRKCTMSHSITLGWKEAPSMSSTSGWMMDRINWIRDTIRCEGDYWSLKG